jgi:hypothetical protein
MILKAKEIIKILTDREKVTQKDLANILTQKCSKKYTQGSLSQKINRGTISYNEVVMIADILGYNINFERKEN